MISSLIMYNFQSHKRTKLSFCSGVNVVIGPSDVGKTAIFRALIWLITNRPSGDAFRSSWAKETKVVLVFNKDKIVRSKGKRFNSYFINDQEYVAFGQDVPKNIVEILNFSDLNIQTQLDPPFLLSCSSGEAARYLNRIVSLDSIDRALANIVKCIRQEETELKFQQQQQEITSHSLAKLDWISSAELEIQRLETIAEEISIIADSMKRVTVLISSIQEQNNKFIQLVPITKFSEQVDCLIILDRKVRALMSRIDSVKDIVTQIEKLENSLEQQRTVIKYEEQCNSLIQMTKQIESDDQNYRVFSGLIDQIKQAQKQHKQLTIAVKQDEDQFYKLMPDICPLCGADVGGGLNG